MEISCSARFSVIWLFFASLNVMARGGMPGTTNARDQAWVTTASGGEIPENQCSGKFEVTGHLLAG
ncbi:hypothetical protein [Thermosporothrix hazakensis]|jgi:hypothetical protein|uniref:hypothetical protein n=1 Tax=Thermosporothrix hazakensis TaxID=644383 RepID=UPI0010E19F1B|nr:hypothetical protein [Thermosporothrix hazakensis]GCE51425.1 hypothetical protein KTH_62940 [Thermosporothrix hazakensis]